MAFLEGFVNDLSGKTFGSWKVLEFAGYVSLKDGQKKYRYWKCQCICPKATIKLIGGANIVRGVPKSCGCVKKRPYNQGKNNSKYRHGLSDHPLAIVFVAMKQRCYNQKSKAYKNWGGRGIRICDEWLGHPEVFIKWALAGGYQKGLTIDRIDNDGNYSPENCRWVTMIEQANNTRQNLRVTYDGVEYSSLTQLCKKLKLRPGTIFSRIQRGASIEDALAKPIKTNSPRL